MNERWFPLIQNPQGLAFSKCRKRFQVVAAGRRSGKDERSKRKVIHRAIMGSPFHTPRYALCAPTLSQAKEIFWNDLKLFIPRNVMSCDPLETELTIKLAHGSELCVRGLDKPQRIEGSPWDGFVFTETDDMKSGFWQEHLRPCLSDRKGWAIFNGVPEGIGFLYELSKIAKENPDEWAFFTWPSSEVIDSAEIESAKKNMDPRTFRQEYEASFETPSGLVYYCFSDANILPCFDKATGPLFIGVDFNVVPYLGAAIFTVQGNDIFFIDEVIIPNGNTYQLIQEAKNRYGNRITESYPDPAGRHRSTSARVGVTDHVILREAGWEVKSHPRTESVKDRINAMNSRLCNAAGIRHCFFDPRCKTIIDGMRRHGYKKTTSVPDDDHFVHILDAVNYPVDFLFPIGKPAVGSQ